MPITIAQEDDNDQVENINSEIIRNDEDNDQIENINSTETTVYKAHIMQVEKVRKEIAQNDERYRDKLVVRGSVHRRKLAFEPGDKVAIACDHDMNQKTRKRKLEQIYSISGEVVSMCSNNRTVRVKVSGEIKTFAAKNLRKL